MTLTPYPILKGPFLNIDIYSNQVSVRSPCIFAIYMDELLEELRKLGWAATLEMCFWEQQDLQMM